MKKIYLTNSIPYVNAKPHIGHALEFVQTDVIARYNKIIGNDVLTLCGGDENALKNVQAEEKANQPIQEFVDENSQLFLDLTRELNVNFDVWQKGSDTKHHFPSTQKLWELCTKSGDIYKKSYRGLYCVGCELFYTPEELDTNGECFEHPGKKLEEVEEENYFFKLSKYQKQIMELIESSVYEIVPQFRKNEMLSFLKEELQDFSISRTNERAKNWGVPVPNDSKQRMYVWFDALNIYQSGIGFGWDEKTYDKWWPADIHVIGKGIIRFHAIYWPAILLSAGLKLPKKLFVHEYFTVNGQKMSKTLGNVFDPTPLAKQYGSDAVRYYCLAKISPFQDGDFSEEKFIESYNSDLANGIGNLVARVAKLCETTNLKSPEDQSEEWLLGVQESLEVFQFNIALEEIWKKIRSLDQQINLQKPWELKGFQQTTILVDLVEGIKTIAYNLRPFMPETAEQILQQFSGRIKSAAPLFPRI